MVFSVGSGKMAAMARPIAAVSFSQIITEEVGSQKLTANHVKRELCDADEENLLDEEDMHVFDLMPLTDPLHLVRCNACRKPIKTSQYAAHAEICKSVGITEEMISEHHGRTKYKKRPKKDRKKLAAAYDSTPAEEKKRINSAKADLKMSSNFVEMGAISVPVEPRLFRMYKNAQGNSSCVEGEAIVDCSGSGPGISDYSTDAIPPTAKRSKLILAEAVSKSEHLRIATGVAESSCQKTQRHDTCRGHLKGSTGDCKQCTGCVGHHKLDQVHGFGLQLQRQEVSALFGTKMYYSLRNHRLRAAVKCMYYESFSEEQTDDVHLNVSQGDENEVQVSFRTNPRGEFEVPREKGEEPSTFATSVREPEQVLADCSDVYMGKIGLIPHTDIPNQDPVDSSLDSQATSTGNTRSNYLQQSFPFAGNSGSSLGTMQQPKGSVPVT